MNKSKGLPRFYVVPTASDFAVYDQSECRCVTDLLMLEKEAKTLCRLLNNHAAPARVKDFTP